MNNTDPTSFKSVLEGVQRLRQQHAGSDDGHATKPAVSQNVESSPGEKTRKVVNAMNPAAFEVNPTAEKQASKRSFYDASKGSTVLVNQTQKENPLLNHLKNTNWRYISSLGGNKIYYDYFIRKRSVLFLTLTYHRLYADYISRRIMPLSKNNDNILLFIVDDVHPEDALKDLTKLCMFNGFTLLVAFSFEQAAKYIEYLNK